MPKLTPEERARRDVQRRLGNLASIESKAAAERVFLGKPPLVESAPDADAQRRIQDAGARHALPLALAGIAVGGILAAATTMISTVSHWITFSVCGIFMALLYWALWLTLEFTQRALLWRFLVFSGIMLLYGFLAIVLIGQDQAQRAQIARDNSALQCTLHIQRHPSFAVGSRALGVPWQKGSSYCQLTFLASEEIEDVDVVAGLDAYTYGASSPEQQVGLQPWPGVSGGLAINQNGHEYDEGPTGQSSLIRSYAVHISRLSPNQPATVYLFVPETDDVFFNHGAAAEMSDVRLGPDPAPGVMKPTSVQILDGTYRVFHGDSTSCYKFAPPLLRDGRTISNNGVLKN